MTKILTRISLIFFLGVNLVACGQGTVPSQIAEQHPVSSVAGEVIFSDVTDEEAQTVDSAQAIEPDEISLKKRYAKVNFNILKKEAAKVAVGETQKVFIRMPLNLFKDEVVNILIDEVQKLAADNVIFTGKIAGDLDSGVSLVVNKEAFVANIRRSDKTESYEVRYAGNGIHAINLKQDNNEDPCPAVEVAGNDEESHDHAEDTDLVDSAQSSPVISILGAYTPGAKTKMGGTSGIVALIQSGVADTNRALADSGSSLRVTLAGTMELERNESGNWSNDLSYAASKTDSRWNGIHAKRTALRADQVSVIANYSSTSGTNGIGYIRASYSRAFTVNRTSSFGVYTFSHELGHNLGLNHSDGYVNSAGRFRTIIAYGSYPRIRRYSNPALTYNGYKTGDSYHNEARIINGYGSTIASFL